MSWAKPGIKVVCISDEKRRLNDRGLPPFLKGQILTISKVENWPEYGSMLYFVERNPRQCGHINGFRPLISKTQEQDIEMFLRLASPSPLERLDLLAERMNELAED